MNLLDKKLWIYIVSKFNFSKLPKQKQIINSIMEKF